MDWTAWHLYQMDSCQQNVPRCISRRTSSDDRLLAQTSKWRFFASIRKPPCFQSALAQLFQVAKSSFCTCGWQVPHISGVKRCLTLLRQIGTAGHKYSDAISALSKGNAESKQTALRILELLEGANIPPQESNRLASAASTLCMQEGVFSILRPTGAVQTDNRSALCLR